MRTNSEADVRQNRSFESPFDAQRPPERFFRAGPGSRLALSGMHPPPRHRREGRRRREELGFVAVFDGETPSNVSPSKTATGRAPIPLLPGAGTAFPFMHAFVNQIGSVRAEMIDKGVHGRKAAPFRHGARAPQRGPLHRARAHAESACSAHSS